MMLNDSSHNSMNTTPSLRWLNMKLLSSPPTSPASGLVTHGKGQYNSFFTHFKEKLHLLDSLVDESDKIPKTTHIVCNKQSSLFPILSWFMSWMLFGGKKLDPQAHSATKAV